MENLVLQHCLCPPHRNGRLGNYSSAILGPVCHRGQPLLPYLCCGSMHQPRSPHLSVKLLGRLRQELYRIVNGGDVAGGLQDSAALPYATGQQQFENGQDFMTQAQIHSRSLALHMRQVSLLQGFSHEASIASRHSAVPACLPHVLRLLAACGESRDAGVHSLLLRPVHTEVTERQLPNIH